MNSFSAILNASTSIPIIEGNINDGAFDPPKMGKKSEKNSAGNAVVNTNMLGKMQSMGFLTPLVKP